jgi:hypothetical protein
MGIGLKSLIPAAALAASAIAISTERPAAADSPKPPSASKISHPARHQTSGYVKINSSHVIMFPRLFPDFAANGIYHHAHHN